MKNIKLALLVSFLLLSIPSNSQLLMFQFRKMDIMRHRSSKADKDLYSFLELVPSAWQLQNPAAFNFNEVLMFYKDEFTYLKLDIGTASKVCKFEGKYVLYGNTITITFKGKSPVKYQIEAPTKDKIIISGNNQKFIFARQNTSEDHFKENFVRETINKVNGNYCIGSSNFIDGTLDNIKTSMPQQRRVCSYCKGTGKVASSDTPTYGQSGTKWCDYCKKEVPISHCCQCEICPSCSGKGYTR